MSININNNNNDNTNLGTVMETFINKDTDNKKTERIPLFTEINATTPIYHRGRLNVNSFGTIDLENFEGNTDDLIHKIGADFHATYNDKVAYMNPVTGEIEENNTPILCNSVTGKKICNTSSTYKIIDFDEAIYCFMALLSEIENHGYVTSPAYAKVYDGGTKLFLQYKIFGGELEGEPTDTYLSLITSHDSSYSMTITLSMIRLFCQNQVARLLKHATSKISLRHSTMGQEAVKAINAHGINKNAAVLTAHNNVGRTLSLISNYTSAMKDYVKELSKIKVADKQIYDALVAMSTLEEVNTPKKVTHFINETNTFFGCLEQSDITPWRGTALGAYYGYSDYLDHTKKTSSFEKSLNGNSALALGNFIDILINIAK